MRINATAEYTTQEAQALIASYLLALFNNTQQTVDAVVVTIKDPTPVPIPTLNFAAPVPQSVLNIMLDRSSGYFNKIGAIKEYRAITGLGLKEAKDYVEHIYDTIINHHIPPRSV